MARRKHVAVRDPEPETEPEPEPEPAVETSGDDDDEEEEEASGDFEAPGTPPSPKASDFWVKPISPARGASSSVAAKPTSSKRKSQAKEVTGDDGGDRENDKKRTKISASVPFVKVWNNEDEICLLQGMLDYHNAKGVHPSTNMSAFHEFINGRLSVDKSKVQVYEKVRRLKDKFFKRCGKENVFSDAHDSEIFEISVKIWGCEESEKKEAGKLADKRVKGGGEKKGASKVTEETVKEGQKKGSVNVAEEGVKDVDAAVKEGCEVNEKKEAGKLADKRVKEGGKKKGASKLTDETAKERQKKGSVKVAEQGEKDVDAAVNQGGGDFQSKYPYLYRSFDNDRFLRDDQKMHMREKLSLIDSSKTKVWDERWKNLYKQEEKLLLMKSSLMEELNDKVVDSLKQR